MDSLQLLDGDSTGGKVHQGGRTTGHSCKDKVPFSGFLEDFMYLICAGYAALVRVGVAGFKDLNVGQAAFLPHLYHPHPVAGSRP